MTCSSGDLRQGNQKCLSALLRCRSCICTKIALMQHSRAHPCRSQQHPSTLLRLACAHQAPQLQGATEWKDDPASTISHCISGHNIGHTCRNTEPLHTGATLLCAAHQPGLCTACHLTTAILQPGTQVAVPPMPLSQSSHQKHAHAANSMAHTAC